jgi:CelD/BcsL family acetyltransferase involved in cellulose biosynthesis
MTMQGDILDLEPAMRLRASPRQPAVPGLGVLRIEIALLKDCAHLQREWRDLAGRTLESNALFQPGLLLGAARHLAALHPATALLVWLERGETRRLVGLLPLLGDAAGLGPRTVSVYSSPYHNLGVPLIDREVALPVMSEVITFLAGVDPAITALKFTNIPLDGAFAAILSKAMRQTGRTLDVTPAGRRAILRPLGPDEASLEERLPAKRRRELARIERKLIALGQVRYHEARGTGARDALETFLALEASGWKGQAGTALVQTPRSASFIRSAYREFAGVDQGRVVWLSLDGRPIAAGLIFDSPGRSWFAKIAYDETLAHVSPGVQLVMAFSRRQAKNREVALTDSCATPNHPLMDPLWLDTMEMGDIIVGVQPGRSLGLAATGFSHRLRKGLRARLKLAIQTALGRNRPQRPSLTPRRATGGE